MFPGSMRARAALAAILVLVPSAACAQDSYSDPAGSGVLVSAINWLQGTLLGTIITATATSIASTREEWSSCK
jgi:type IV secretion system protein VirB2